MKPAPSTKTHPTAAVRAVPGAREAMARAGIDPQRRGETLSVEEFASIERAL